MVVLMIFCVFIYSFLFMLCKYQEYYLKGKSILLHMFVLFVLFYSIILGCRHHSCQIDQPRYI